MSNKNKKEVPQTLFGTMARKYQSAHRLSVALNMVGLGVDIETCELIDRTLKEVVRVGGKFDLKMAIDLKLSFEDEMSLLKEKFNNNKNGKA